MKKALIIIMTLLLSLTMVGCGKVVFTTGIGENNIMKVSGQTMSKGEALFAFLKGVHEYEESFGSEIWGQEINGMTMEDYLKSTIKARLIETKTMCLFAEEKGVKTDSALLEEANASANSWIEKMGADYLNEKGVSAEDVTNYFADELLSKKVYNTLISNVDYEISDADTKVIEVYYIFFGNEEGAETTASAALERAKAGEDFAALVKEYSLDEEYDYVFGHNEAYKEFEDAAFSLEDGQISDIVSCENGLYIIKCIEDYMVEETKANREKIIDNIKKEAVEDEYIPFANEQALEFDNDYWDGLKVSDYV